jgi:hydroxyethylthiazole kinase-like uncharacterized protein yjeF
MAHTRQWTPGDAAHLIARPSAGDDKYSRGVLGVITGSADYPGAAVLGVEAALRTGVGMVRYLGSPRPAQLVLQRRPEAVTVPGRVQAWLLGSGMTDADAGASNDAATEPLVMPRRALAEGLPTILDAGCLSLLGDATGPTVITPHHRELARLLEVDLDEIAADPARSADRAATELGVTVLLKGAQTHIADPHGQHFVCGPATPWLATAGTGDALGGVLGALVATHVAAIHADERMLAQLAATASVVHSLAAERASAGGPFTVLDLTAALPPTIADLLA